MSVTNKTNTVQEAGNGSKVAFTFDFKIFNASDLVVKEIDQTTLVATDKTITTDYTVSINATTEGGTVTYITAPVSGVDSFIKRLMDIDQQTNVPTEGNIPEDSLNNEYDKSRMIDIQQQEELDRSIKFAETSALSGIDFPESTSAASRANKVIAYDAAGTGLELLEPTVIDAVSVITTLGDLVQGGSGGDAEKLGIGSTDDVLQVVAGKAAWVTGTGSGIVVLTTSPTIITPTIASLINMTHDHADAAGGGNTLTAPTLTTPSSDDITLTGSAASTPDANTITKNHLIGAHCLFDGTGTPAYTKEINFSGAITDDGVGLWTLTIDRDFADANYTAHATVGGTAGAAVASVHSEAVGAISVAAESNAGTDLDPSRVNVTLIGDQ